MKIRMLLFLSVAVAFLGGCYHGSPPPGAVGPAYYEEPSGAVAPVPYEPPPSGSVGPAGRRGY